MTADPRSLAGIEGLLLECSPCRLLAFKGVPEHLVGELVSVWSASAPHPEWRGSVAVAPGRNGTKDGLLHLDIDAVELRLDHKTGRAHAAWYVDAWLDKVRCGLRSDASERFDDLFLKHDEAILSNARRGWGLHPDAIERLRDLVLLAADMSGAVATAPPSDR